MTLLATGFYQMARTLQPGDGDNPWLDQFGLSYFIHNAVAGILPDDNSYIRNDAGNGLIVVTDFRIADLPVTMQSLVLSYRFKTFSTDVIDFRFRIFFSQGKPVHGFGDEVTNNFKRININQQFPIREFTTFTEVIPIIDITDVRDVWVSVVARPRVFLGFDFFDILHISWLTVEATFILGTDAPTPISYNKGLSFIDLPAVTVIGDAGSTTWKYRVIPCNSHGCGVASEEVTVTDGNDTLGNDNFNCITWNDVVGTGDSGAMFYKIYRISAGGTPSTLGLIGTLVESGEGTCDEDDGFGGGGTGGFKDTGIAADEDDVFTEEMCQGVSSITYPAKETPG